MITVILLWTRYKFLQSEIKFWIQVLFIIYYRTNLENIFHLLMNQIIYWKCLIYYYHYSVTMIIIANAHLQEEKETE